MKDDIYVTGRYSNLSLVE